MEFFCEEALSLLFHLFVYLAIYIRMGARVFTFLRVVIQCRDVTSLLGLFQI